MHDSHTHCQAAQANAQTKAWQRVCLSNRTAKTTDKPTNEKEARLPNIQTLTFIRVDETPHKKSPNSYPELLGRFVYSVFDDYPPVY